MANNLNLDGLDDSVVRRAEAIADAMADTRNATTELNKQLRDQSLLASTVSGVYTNISRSASQVAGIQREAVKSAKGLAKAAKEQENIQDNVRRLNQKINTLYEQAKNTNGENRKLLLDQAQNLANARDNAKALGDEYAKIVETAAGLDKRTKFFGSMSTLVSDIPGLRKLAGPFQEAEKAAKKLLVDTKGGASSFKVFAAGGKAFASSAFSAAKSFLGPVGIVLALKKAVDIFLKLNSENVEFGKTMNITAEESANIRKELTASAKGFDYMNNSLGAAYENMAAFSKQFGIVATSLDRDILDGVEVLEKRFGLTKENALGFAKNAILAGKSTKDFTAEIIGAAEATEIANSVNLTQQTILEDIGKLNERQRLVLQNNPTLIGKAVAQARSLGLTFANLESSSSKLLDFESSISSELEAELLLGRDLNLETARQAALTNDYATLTSEIAKNIGTAADFSKMNRLQQEALASSVGMTADELGKVLYEQEALTKLGFKDAADRKQKFQDLVKEVGLQKAMKEFGDKEYARQQSLVSVQEKLQTLVANIGNIFMDTLAPEVEKIAAKFTENKDLINDIVGSVKDFATGMMRVGDILNALIVKPIQATYNLIKSIVKTLQSVGQFMTLDFAGGMQSAKLAKKALATSGANVLDVGTNLLTGLGVEGESNYFSNRASEIDVNDFTIRSNPKDTLVMAGGTKFGEETNALLKELITAVKAGGNVYMDGNKVGQALVLSTTKLS